MSAKKNTSAAPLARFVMAPENVRHGVEYDADAIAALAGSIRAFGRLLEPLKVYQDGDALRVWDGGRRLAALELLAQDETPPALLDAVAYDLTGRDDVGLASMATFLRQPLHPAEAFFAYAALFDAGQTPEQIGAACAVSAKEVAKLLRFRVLAPEVIAAFKAGAMDFDACLAFTLSTDHEEQRGVLASFGDRIPRDWQVREAFRKATVSASHSFAVIVGREAYVAAGGRILEDLFSRDGDLWQDPALVLRLYNDKLATLLAEVEAEGWGSVTFTDDRFNFSNGMVQVEPEGDDFTDEEKAALSSFVMIDYPAALTVARGYRRRAKVQAGSAGAASVKPAQADPARWGWGHGGHDVTTSSVTHAVRAALIADPAAAYDATVAHLAWEALGWGGAAASGLAVTKLCVQPAEREAADAWTARLPCEDRAAFYPAVAALDADVKATLLAFAFALTVNVREGRTDSHNTARWGQLGWIARRAGVTATEAFGVPTDDFLKGGSRAALLTAVADLSPGVEVRMADAKKSALVIYVRSKSGTEGGWAPVLIRDLLTDPAADKPAKAPRQGRGRGKVAPATVDPSNDETETLAAA